MIHRPDIPEDASYRSALVCSWSGHAAIGMGWGYFHGTIGDVEPHQHSALQIVVATTPQRIWLQGAGFLDCHGVLIAPGVEHQLLQTDATLKVVYLEREDPVIRHLTAGLDRGWRILSQAESAAMWCSLERADPGQIREAVLAHLGAATDPTEPADDTLIRRILQQLPRPLPEKLSIAELAHASNLSPSRFQHRFARHTGMAVRPYLRWLRLLTAMSGIARGDSLTHAAVDAGFSDAAHFSRTFRRHFGFSPRHLLQIALTH